MRPASTLAITAAARVSPGSDQLNAEVAGCDASAAHTLPKPGWRAARAAKFHTTAVASAGIATPGARAASISTGTATVRSPVLVRESKARAGRTGTYRPLLAIGAASDVMYPTMSTTTCPVPVPNQPVTETPLVPTGMMAVLATDVPGTRLTVDVPATTSGRSVGKAWIQPACVADVPVTVITNACTWVMSTPGGDGTGRGTRLPSGAPSLRVSSTRCGAPSSTKRPAATGWGAAVK